MGEFHNRQDLIARRRELRRDATRAEGLLWMALRKRRAEGLRFRRQHSVGPYILDFYCPACRLAIEVDGSSHDNDLVHERDMRREAYLLACRIRVVRFTNREVEQDLEAVTRAIIAAALR